MSNSLRLSGNLDDVCREMSMEPGQCLVTPTKLTSTDSTTVTEVLASVTRACSSNAS